jgi:hypothetical protein
MRNWDNSNLWLEMKQTKTKKVFMAMLPIFDIKYYLIVINSFILAQIFSKNYIKFN